jgi:hypothetical protein
MRLSRRITVTWRRADELAVLLARAITRRFVVVAADVGLSVPRRCTRSRTLSSVDMCSAWMGGCLQ